MSGRELLPESSRGEITRHLLAWSAGDAASIHHVFAVLHGALRRMAGRVLSRERPNHTLETAGLVSETFFRMLEQQRVEWQSREHFLATAAQMMRRILVDYSRTRGRVKRGGGVAAVPLVEDELAPSGSLDELPAIHEALEALAAVDRMQSDIVEMRFFGGMTHEEIARHLGVSLPTIERRWRLARAWLYRSLKASA